MSKIRDSQGLPAVHSSLNGAGILAVEKRRVESKVTSNMVTERVQFLGNGKGNYPDALSSHSYTTNRAKRAVFRPKPIVPP